MKSRPSSKVTANMRQSEAFSGHDINYIGLSGVLDRIGRDGQPPTIPLNVVGDYGGRALYLALGVVSGILDARQSGRGQVLDVAMIDGSTSLLAKQFGLLAAGQVNPGRAQNLLDGGRRFTMSMRAPMDCSSPWARSSRNSLRCCCAASAFRRPRSRRSTTGLGGLRYGGSLGSAF